jgi:type III pantothenate kinase
MLLAVDIGNSLTKFAVFEGDDLTTKFSVETDSDDLVGAIEGRLDSGFDSAIVCSVVPDAAERLGRLLVHGFGVDPIWVDSETDVGLIVKHEPRTSLGTDRLVNSFAAAEKYGTPVIVCSFGTATTIDLVNKKREMVGGLIAPGMQLMARSLHEHTAKLPEIDAAAPDDILGTTTEDAIRSGIYLSIVGLVESAVDNIREKYRNPQTVATGGFARAIAAATDRIDVVDEDLTLEGLRLIAVKVNA